VVWKTALKDDPLTDDTARAHRARLILAAGFAVLLIGGGARFALGLTLKPMAEELGWSRTILGTAVALFQVVSAVCTFGAGVLVDRISLRVVLASGVVVAALGIGLMGVVTQPWHALAFYGGLFAIGNGLASSATVGVMVTRAFPARTGFANAAVLSGMSIGQIVVIAALASVLVSIGWRSVFFWLGLAHLVVVPFVFMASPGARGGASQTAVPGMTLTEALHTPRFWVVLGIYALCGFDDFFVSTHVVAFAQDKGIDAYLAGNLLALMGVTGLFGVIAAGLFGDRFGPVWTTAASFAVRMAMFALIAVDQSPLSVAIFALVFGVTFLVTAPLTILFVRDYFGTRYLGSIVGLITMVHHIFGGMGALIGAALFDATGQYTAAFVVMFVASTVALALSLSLVRKRV
jgi:predicted MFS family arabinose efflux permease